MHMMAIDQILEAARIGKDGIYEVTPGDFRRLECTQQLNVIMRSMIRKYWPLSAALKNGALSWYEPHPQSKLSLTTEIWNTS